MASNTTTPSTVTFHHDQLGIFCAGPMTGVITPDNVVQFRAVPYATIPKRFTRSVVNTDLGGKADFTKHGYACPQTFPPRVNSGGPIPGELNPPISSEFSCLILQLTIPLAHLESLSSSSPKLPVLIYIHGGGFVLGGIDEHHSTALMTEQSILDNQPIISASIQYRLGALGFLHTPEKGGANIALHDQRNALLWIQQFIAGFGGNKDQVTLFGESGGSISICAQMLFPPPEAGPLFKRAILMSGVLGATFVPKSKEYAGRVYEKFLETLGIEERGENGLERLRELDVQALVDATAEFTKGGGLFRTVLDEDWFGLDEESARWDKVPELIGKCDWVEEIVIGTTSLEGAHFMARLEGITPQAFIAGIAKQLGNESAQLICQAYNITPDMDQNLFVTSAMRWVGDVVFAAPQHQWTKYLSTHTNKKIYQYTFDVRNPFPCQALYQLPHHWVDKYFVFKTLQFRYPSQRLRDISTKHAQLWIDVAHGKAPWTEYKYTGNGDEITMVADEREGWVERTVAENERIMDITPKRFEALLTSWEDFKGKSFAPMEIDPLEGKSMV